MTPFFKRQPGNAIESFERSNAYFAKSGAIFLQASTRPCTEATDFLNISCSALASAIFDDALDTLLADHHRHADVQDPSRRIRR